MHNGGKWQTTWFDGKPQLYISIFGPELVSKLLFSSSVIHHLTREIKVWKIKDLQQLVSTEFKTMTGGK